MKTPPLPASLRRRRLAPFAPAGERRARGRLSLVPDPPASSPPALCPDPCDRGLALWRRAVAARWPMLALAGWLGFAAAPALTAAPLAAQPSAAAPAPRVGLTLRGGPDGVEIPAPVLATDVAIRVTGLLARARVTQRFTNPADSWMEGVYTFPLPADAAVDGLRLVIGERVLEGQIREREEARQIYQQAKREGVKASLVSQNRPNLFTTRVANVAPGEQVEVVLEYQQTLIWDSGSFRLRFPMTITPRYTPHGEGALPQLGLAALTAAAQSTWHGAVAVAQNAATASSPAAVAVTAVVESEPHACGDDELPPVAHPLRLTVELDAGFPLQSLSSRHHDFDVELLGKGSGSGDRYRIRLLDEEDRQIPEVEADRDFELVWEPEVGAEPRSALFTEEIGGDVYALLMVLPPDPETPGFSRLPRETIFVIDTSGSMGGASIEQAKAALVTALERLQPEDSFNVLAFNSTTRALFPGSWPADPGSVERARAWVEKLRAGGGTEMMPALLAALDGRPDGYGQSGARAVKQVIFITDGAVSNEGQLFSAIERHLGQARLFPVGIGSAPNGHFLERAAALGRGTATFIGNPWEVGSRMGELFAKLESPALTGLDVVWDDPGAEMFPPRIPDLYTGEPVVVAARLLSLGDEIRVSGERDGSFWEASFATRAVAAETVTSGTAASGTAAAAAGALRTPSPAGFPDGGLETAGIGKLWARRAIAALMDEHRRAPGPAAGRPETPERDEIRRRVVELALAHHLVSRFTSLVAVDVTPSRSPGERLESRHVPNAVPAGSTGGFEQLPMGATGSRLYLLAGLLLLGTALVGAALLLARD